MSVQKYDSTTKLLKLIAGGTLFADCPVGVINPYGGATAPDGWLLCHGQALSRTEYADLFAVIGTNFGSGDGSTTFNLPDPREASLVGAGTNVLNASSISEHNAVTLGAFQDDQLQNHEHLIRADNLVQYAHLTADQAGSTIVGTKSTSGLSYSAKDISQGRSGTTTHGKQLGVNYIIKAKQTPVPADVLTKLEELLDSKQLLSWGNGT